VDDDKDFDYVPPTDLSLEEAEDNIEEYEWLYFRRDIALCLFTFFLIFRSWFSLLIR